MDGWDHFIAGGFSDEGNYYLPDAELERILKPGPGYVAYPEEGLQSDEASTAPAAQSSPTYDTGESEMELFDSSDSEREETNLNKRRLKPLPKRVVTRRGPTGA
ncbi:hypothetical protein BDV98DRAFT_576967 [Pterulicium gracile]|uniref:Uncharacterized protein n=1 Tax=Pterulicium gracile TaxID=1884261 RepID=A0A5C3QC15_9AGAR|nr:hypothetical protein BDV98DRAFT_576967 [Pterula gracilis]